MPASCCRRSSCCASGSHHGAAALLLSLPLPLLPLPRLSPLPAALVTLGRLTSVWGSSVSATIVRAGTQTAPTPNAAQGTLAGRGMCERGCAKARGLQGLMAEQRLKFRCEEDALNLLLGLLCCLLRSRNFGIDKPRGLAIPLSMHASSNHET